MRGPLASSSTGAASKNGKRETFAPKGLRTRNAPRQTPAVNAHPMRIIRSVEVSAASAQSARLHISDRSGKGKSPPVPNSQLIVIAGSNAAAMSGALADGRRRASAHAAKAIARNNAASGLDRDVRPASAAAAMCDRDSIATAAKANAEPSANDRRPTTRFDTMPKANAAVA